MMINKVWERMRLCFIDYITKNHFAYMLLFLRGHKLIPKPRTKNGLTNKYIENARKKIYETMFEIIDYETIKVFTDSDDKTLNMDSGGLLGVDKGNKLWKKMFDELITFTDKDIIEVVEVLYESRTKNKKCKKIIN